MSEEATYKNMTSTSVWASVYKSLSVRTKNGLSILNVSSMKGILLLSEHDFLSIRGMGRKCWSEVASAQEKLRSSPMDAGELCAFDACDLIESFPLFCGLANEGSDRAKAFSTVSALSVVPSVRSRNVLEKAQIKTLDELLFTTPDELLRERSCGRKTINEIKKAVREYLIRMKGKGFELAPEGAGDFPFFSGAFVDDRPVPEGLFPDTPVRCFVSSARGKAVLESSGVHTLGALLLSNEDELFKKRNCGKKTIKELRESILGYLVYQAGSEREIELADSFSQWMCRLCSDVHLEQYSAMAVARICNGRTLESAAQEFKCTRERVRQVVKKISESVSENYKTKDELVYFKKTVNKFLQNSRGIVGWDALSSELKSCFNWSQPIADGALWLFFHVFQSSLGEYQCNKSSLSGAHPCRSCLFIREAIKSDVLAQASESVLRSVGRIKKLGAQKTLWGCECSGLNITDEFLEELVELSGLTYDEEFIYTKLSRRLQKGGINKNI